MQADPAGIDFLRREAESALEGFEIDRAKDIGNLLEADYGDRADAWLTIADIAKATGGSSEFERSLRRALDLSPGNVRTFARLEALLRGQKRFEELLALVDQLIQAKPSIKADASATLHRVAGEILMKVGHRRH
jgi:tetratricopeptide (TPR) repeat protein